MRKWIELGKSIELKNQTWNQSWIWWIGSRESVYATDAYFELEEKRLSEPISKPFQVNNLQF